MKCPECDTVIYTKDLIKNLHVCGKCAHHFRLSATERLKTLFDDERWEEIAPNLTSNDPLKFTDTKPYKSRLAATQKSTGQKDAVIVGVGKINGVDAVVASMEYSFIGGSMGVVVGEKIVRGIELALERRMPMLIVSCSGGARMMEGALSLMQMAKISAALARLDRARLPYISILTDPTTGGVTASFAMLGDLNIAEPKALIGFAGPARDRADDPPEAARRLPAQRVPARARHARSRRRSPRDEGDARPGAAFMARPRASPSVQPANQAR